VKQGLLAQHFKGIAVKSLKAVETNRAVSNQHEYNGTRKMEQIFGTVDRTFTARFIWLGDEQDAMTEDGTVTWYDTRANQPHRRPEFRLYFPSNAVTEQAKEGDSLFVALRTDDSVLIVIAPSDSTIQGQLLWLFGLPDQPKLSFQAQAITETADKMDFAVRYILEELGIEPEEPDSDLLDGLLEKFGKVFPSMAVFSALARQTLPDVSALDDPDAALLAWLEREEFLFRRLERHILADRIKEGFVANGKADVDGFIAVSLSVQNRRKARAGGSLENHLEFIFQQRQILVGRECVTELKNKPDFLFPGCKYYSDHEFPKTYLSMLAAKSSVKERWRQILAEANRIEEKHLLTLSPGISINQTEQMKAEKLRLVIPAGLHQTYHATQQSWLMTLADFIALVKTRQDAAPLYEQPVL
jgi:hypothetical protein